MNTLKLVSILILLCGVLSFSGCLGDGGNTLSVYSTGSIYKTSTGTSYMFIDRAGISATSAELQGERLEVGDRILATTTIDFDNQGTQLAQGIYNATIAGVHKFDCKSYTFDNSISSFASDTLPTLYGVEPFLSYRKDDTILTFAYVKHDVENGDPSSLKLVQPKLYNPEAKTDTLFLIYEKGNIKDSKSSDYISFKLPQYPSDTDINVVVRYNADSSNLSTNNGDKTSKLFSITYNRPSTLN